MLPATKTTLAFARGAGSLGPSDHLSTLPTCTVVATYTVSVALDPSVPPKYRIWVPTWMEDPSVLAAGRLSSGGDVSHGTVGPPGAGHGSEPLVGGQKLIGDHTRTPRSTVRPTVKYYARSGR